MKFVGSMIPFQNKIVPVDRKWLGIAHTDLPFENAQYLHFSLVLRPEKFCVLDL
jgi:hypothetical protein